MIRAGVAMLFMAAGCESPAPQKAKQTKEKVADFDPLRDAPETNEKMIQLAVPFVCQAPTGNWKSPFDDACEEACLLMAQWYLTGAKDIDPEEAEREIRAIVDRVAKKGHGVDIGAGTVGEIAEEHYGLKSRVYKGAANSVNMKRLLAADHPVIIPVAQFKNPFFKSELPYHMVVVTGFDETRSDGPVFLANDPGTRHGKAYPYPEGYLLNRIHDWNGSRETVAKAPTAMLVLGK